MLARLARKIGDMTRRSNDRSRYRPVPGNTDVRTAAQSGARFIFCTQEEFDMRYSIVIAVALFALALSACERAAVVAPPAPVAVVAVPVPGPAGPQGASGAPVEKGDAGAPGATGATWLDRRHRRRRCQGQQGQNGRRHDRGGSCARSAALIGAAELLQPSEQSADAPDWQPLILA